MYRLKIETRKLYWLHARYGTFNVRRKYARRTLRHECCLCKCTSHFLRRFSNGTETFFWPLLYVCVYLLRANVVDEANTLLYSH